MYISAMFSLSDLPQIIFFITSFILYVAHQATSATLYKKVIIALKNSQETFGKGIAERPMTYQT